MRRPWLVWAGRQVAGLAVLGALFGVMVEAARILTERAR